MEIEIEYGTYVEIMEDIVSLISFKQMEGFDIKRELGLLKCMRGILKKHAGVTINLKRDSLGDYHLSRKEETAPGKMRG